MFTVKLLPMGSRKTKYTGPFSLPVSSDFVEKDKQYLLDVLFQPIVDGNAEARLILEVEQNPYTVTVLLKGIGQCARLDIQESTIDFGAILPYQIENERQFCIQNTSCFPIEIYFPDFD